jgi:guanylate kinase
LGSSIGRRLPVFVMTGTSGAGKGTLVQELVRRVPELELAVSATTRARRPGEEHGVHYWFLENDDFDRLLEHDGFLEYFEFPWGQRSGTLWAELDRITAHGKAPLLELETHGALAVQERIPGAITIFITAPTFEELERRLRDRATESAGEIDERLALARNQLEQAQEFTHVVVNDEIGRAADELARLVTRELAATGTMAP